ncbi:MAG: FtsQ-type POTRA domain-containing protein [Ruminococcaceae bacterium]|nr:FtsQ-type POTRA domain-containing protein [Oscillospiraceae bacterium]
MSRTDVEKAKRKNKKKRRKAALLILLSVVALALVIGLSVTVFFPVKNIIILGSTFYDSETVLKASGISENDNLLLISEEKIFDKIQKELAFVDSIEIKRKLPDTLKITVNDAKEIFCYKINEAFYSTDKNGRVLKEYSACPSGVIYVECTATLENKDINKISLSDPKAVSVINEIGANAYKFSVMPSYIDLTDMYGIRMGIDSRFTVEFGESVYFKEKLLLLFEMMETKSENDSGVFRLDMYNPDNPRGSYFKNN